MACVLVVAGFLIFRSRHDILEMLQRISPALLVASVVLTILAKGFLADNARIAALRNRIQMDFPTAARLYNLSQLGKYLPGSIWQFVGRAAAYRGRGAEYGQIRDALLVESLWIVAGSALVGLVLTGPGVVDIVTGSLNPTIAWWLAGAVSLCVVGGTAGLVWKRELAARYVRLSLPSVRVLAVQAGIWSSLGLAFWVLARACGFDISPVFATGLFAAGYAMGFLVPFAPAGLGVRDGILTLGLLPYIPAGEALAVTILARLVYLLVDVGLVVLQEPVFAVIEARARRNDRRRGA